MESGHNALLVYSSPETYVAACGIDQPCLKLTAEQVDDVLTNSPVDYWIIDLDLNADFDALRAEAAQDERNASVTGEHQKDGSE